MKMFFRTASTRFRYGFKSSSKFKTRFTSFSCSIVRRFLESVDYSIIISRITAFRYVAKSFQIVLKYVQSAFNVRITEIAWRKCSPAHSQPYHTASFVTHVGLCWSKRIFINGCFHRVRIGVVELRINGAMIRDAHVEKKDKQETCAP